MSEIKTLNGYSLADTVARENIATLSEEMVNGPADLSNAQKASWRESIGAAKSESTFDVTYAHGNIDGASGTPSIGNTSTRIRTEQYIPIGVFKSYSCIAGMVDVAWFAYDESYKKLYSTSWMTVGGVAKSDIIAACPNAKYLLFLFRKNSAESITMEYFESSGVVIATSVQSGAYSGKIVSIYGDSISTYEGYIPDGNRYTYPGSGVTSVDDTWWKKTIDALDMELLVNNSWSGRCVSNVADASTGNLNSGGWKAENVAQLGANGVVPDVVIVKLGINDVNRDVAIGEYDGTQTFPTEATNFRESYAIMLKEIMSAFPLAEVWCCTLMQSERNGAASFPEASTGGKLVAEYNAVIRYMADLFGAKVLDHASCGITYFNLSSYMGDWNVSESRGLHPNAAGHALIAYDTVKTLEPTATMD